jgi:hypothetical protein
MAGMDASRTGKTDGSKGQEMAQSRGETVVSGAKPQSTGLAITSTPGVATGIIWPHHGKAGPMRTFGIMTAIAAGLFGVIWGLAEYGISTACTSDPGLGGGADCYPWVQNLHPVIAPAALTAAAVAVITALLIGPRHAAGTRLRGR